MNVERIFWLVVGVLFIVFAIIALFSDTLDIEQKTMDAIQNIAIGVLALGLAARGVVWSR